MKKYELTEEFKINNFGTKLFRIKALVDIEKHGVKKGDLGGWIEKESNLSHGGNAKVYGDAWVGGNAKVYGDAEVCGNAWVGGDAEVYGNAWVGGNAKVYGDAEVCGNADYATVKGFGTELRTTTFFRCSDENVRVKCGCFYGTIEEFRKQVKMTRGGKIADEYLMIADLMEMHFREEDEKCFTGGVRSVADRQKWQCFAKNVKK